MRSKFYIKKLSDFRMFVQNVTLYATRDIKYMCTKHRRLLSVQISNAESIPFHFFTLLHFAFGNGFDINIKGIRNLNCKHI